MAEHKEPESGQATKGIGGSDSRRHNEISTGVGESGSAREESNRGVLHSSDRAAHHGESGENRPSPPDQPDVNPLTLGTNGGGRDDNQPAGTDSGRTPRGTEAHSEHRKAS